MRFKLFKNTNKEIENLNVQVKIEPYIHMLSQLPEWADKDYRVKEGEEYYTVNLFYYQCSCSVFSFRANLGILDSRRVCKHLYTKIQSSTFSSFFGDLDILIIQNNLMYNNPDYYKMESHGVPAIIDSSGKEWITVLFRAKGLPKEEYGDYKKYTYNIKQHRWSYNHAPYSADVKLIEKGIRQLRHDL